MDNFKKSLHNERISYDKSSISLETTELNPFLQFDLWYHQAAELGTFEANAMAIATVDKTGKPTNRVVLLKEYSKEGFVFFTNYESHKGSDLELNPNIAVLFFYEPLQRQIRISGVVQRLSDKENDDYFYSRPIESQYGAMVSPQSRKIANKQDVELAVKELLATNKKPQRPKSWGGYIVKANFFEFWQGRPNRIHDRICYQLEKSEWQKFQIAP